MPTSVIHIRDMKPGDVYIGRAGKGMDGYFGNPFILTKETDRDRILVQYVLYFNERIENDKKFRDRVLALQGKRLACFCKPEACHGDVIASYLNFLERESVQV